MKLIFVAWLAVEILNAQVAAPTPPMGWNSWDSFGLTVTEAEFLDSSAYMAAHLKQFGWQYAVVDEGWYLFNPQAKVSEFEFKLDEAGRYVPVENRFPSAVGGKGFAALASKVHAQGLKFGIHIIRGIPKLAVERKLKIGDSAFVAADAADTGDTCPWNADNFGVKSNPAGQAYYDSLMKLYATWGVDYIKIDCISSHPYKGDEIRMVSAAIRKTGRAMVLSLSPGPTPLEKSGEVSRWADMWRISDDFWDQWKVETGKKFPQDLLSQFQRAAAWAQFTGNGHWPDADMLALGHLGPRPGNDKERDTALTQDEQTTLITLWCMFRSPLIMGGNLTHLDDWTQALLTNAEVLEVDQHSSGGRQICAGDNVAIWTADGAAGDKYLAVFNLGDERLRSFEWTWQQLGLISGNYQLRNLWLHQDLGSADHLSVAVKGHGAVLLRLRR